MSDNGLFLLAGILFLVLCCLQVPSEGRQEQRRKEEEEGESRAKQGDSETEQGMRPERQESSYMLLGLSPGANQEEIAAAYRELCRRYHPDKVSHLGEEFVKLAHEKFREIQEAYDTLSGCSV